MGENTPGVTAERLARLGKGYRGAMEAEVTAREALAAAIHEADTGGWGVREIARAAGVSPATAHRLLTTEATRLQLVHLEES